MSEMVCENHHSKLWPDECQCGAGMPIQERHFRSVTLYQQAGGFNSGSIPLGPFPAFISKNGHFYERADHADSHDDGHRIPAYREISVTVIQ